MNDESGGTSSAFISASSGSIRAILLQITNFYLRTPAKLFRPARFDYMNTSRRIIGPELSGKPYSLLTHSTPALLYESVKRYGWKFIPLRVMPPMIANAAVGMVLYGTYLQCGGGRTGESFGESFRCGSIAGGVSSVIATPIDAGWGKMKNMDIRGAFSGGSVNFVKESIGFGVYFAVFESIKRDGELTSILVAGASAACALIMVQYPFSKIENGEGTIREKITNLYEKRLQSGMRWGQFFYKGIGRHALTNIPATSMGLIVFEIARRDFG